MNTKSFTMLLTDEIIAANHEHNRSIGERIYCPVCDTVVNTMKPLEKCQEPERVLKLNPFPILDTDPSLNISSKTPKSLPSIKRNKIYTQSMKYEIEPTNVNQESLTDIDQLNYATIKKCDLYKTQYPHQRRQKTIQTIASKTLNSTNSTNKTNISSSITNNHQDNQNSNEKDLLGISNQKIILNHVQIPPTRMPRKTKKIFRPARHVNDISKLKETSTVTKEDIKEINNNNYTNSKRKTVLNKNDTSETEQIKLSDKNNKKLNLRMKRKIDNTNNTSAQPINLSNTYVSSMENAHNSFKSPSVQSINKKTEEDILIDISNKSIFDNLDSDVPKKKINSEQHSALRLSLFSNVPPYIRFSSYDVKGESFPLILQKFLKWKFSSVTPIVVRLTIENSGFKLVRSEHSLNNIPALNQLNQIGITIQNHCDITPPIIDDICDTVPQPNELMMLPRSQSNDWVGTWGTYMKSIHFKSLCEQQKLNHFPGTFQIGRKDMLWRNLHRFMLKYGKDQFGFIPKSYILPQQTKLLRQVLEKNEEDKWIIKPPASARGSGIRVITKWNEIPKTIPLVVQRYIDNPYLINDSKFDLRLYILITSMNPLRLYLYDNGLVRFASVKYSSKIETITNRYMHLTNYSINRLSSDYTQNEDANACQGHKWTLRSLWTYMEKELKIDVKELWDRLADLVVKTIISGESPMNQMCHSNLNNRYNAYELFGIDVLFDEYLKPWILEVNISPSLHSSSKLDLAVKGPLIKDLMNMVGYHIPNKMASSTHNTLLKTLGIKSPLCFDERLYTLNLSAEEQKKQELFTNIEFREKYINSILDDLLPDDVRHLIIYEDELSQIGSFKKVFPTTSSHKYHQYFENPRYYNMLFDAWENKYADNRGEGIALLENLCQLKVHFKVPEADEEQPQVPNVLIE